MHQEAFSVFLVILEPLVFLLVVIIMVSIRISVLITLLINVFLAVMRDMLVVTALTELIRYLTTLIHWFMKI